MVVEPPAGDRVVVYSRTLSTCHECQRSSSLRVHRSRHASRWTRRLGQHADSDARIGRAARIGALRSGQLRLRRALPRPTDALASPKRSSKWRRHVLHRLSQSSGSATCERAAHQRRAPASPAALLDGLLAGRRRPAGRVAGARRRPLLLLAVLSHRVGHQPAARPRRLRPRRRQAAPTPGSRCSGRWSVWRAARSGPRRPRGAPRSASIAPTPGSCGTASPATPPAVTSSSSRRSPRGGRCRSGGRRPRIRGLALSYLQHSGTCCFCCSHFWSLEESRCD
eukprot:COSAG04_NODE_222_length_19676_cov_26.070991_8_plen_281_part_00